MEPGGVCERARADSLSQEAGKKRFVTRDCGHRDGFCPGAGLGPDPARRRPAERTGAPL